MSRAGAAGRGLDDPAVTDGCPGRCSAVAGRSATVFTTQGSSRQL